MFKQDLQMSELTKIICKSCLIYWTSCFKVVIQKAKCMPSEILDLSLCFLKVCWFNGGQTDRNRFMS